VHRPKLLLLDEPTAGVDIELRSQLWEFVKKLKTQGVTVLLTTHYLEEAEMLCDRVGIINKGEIKMLGPTQTLIRQFTNRQVEILCKNESSPRTYHLESQQTVGDLLLREKFQIENIQDIRVQEGTLEDAFRRVMRLEPSANGGKA
jgi:ABC-2 type transport system ATP-binding protein